MASKTSSSACKNDSVFQASFPSYLKPIPPSNFILSLVRKISLFVHKKIGMHILVSQKNINMFTPKEGIKGHKVLEDIGGKRFKFKTADNVTLHGMHFLGKDCNTNSPTIVLFNGSAIRYEEYGSQTFTGIRLFTIKSWLKLGVNVVVFNYRGVDYPGTATKRGLTLDTDAVLQYTTQTLKVPESKVIFYGHSLGAGVGSEVAANYPNINFCSDRSFSKLSEEVKFMFGGKIIGIFLSKILKMARWEFDVISNWEKIKGHKWVIYHPHDCVIPKNAALITQLKIKFPSFSDYIELCVRKFKTKSGLEIDENPSLMKKPNQKQINISRNSAHIRKLQGLEEKSLFKKHINIILLK